MAEVPTAMADMEKPPLIYGEKDGFNLGEAANPRNMCVFFFHSLVVPTCQETSQVEVPSDRSVPRVAATLTVLDCVGPCAVSKTVLEQRFQRQRLSRA